MRSESCRKLVTGETLLRGTMLYSFLQKRIVTLCHDTIVPARARALDRDGRIVTNIHVGTHSAWFVLE